MLKDHSLYRLVFKPLSVLAIAISCLAMASISYPRPALASDTDGAPAERIFELRVYHVLPGKMAALEGRFRDTTSRLLQKHNLNVVGFWVGDDSTFVFVVAHRSREDAKKNWSEMLADPAFRAVVQAEIADKTVDKVDSTYMAATDFSPMK